MDSPLYLVVWGGGLEAPSYVLHRTEEAAWNQAREWAADMDEDEGDFVDVLVIRGDTIERLQKGGVAT